MKTKPSLILALWCGVFAGAAALPAAAQNPAIGADLQRALAAVPVAAGTGLFRERSTETQAAVVESVAEGPILRRRAAAVDGGYLGALLAADVGVDGAGRIAAGATAFTLNLLPDVTVRAVKTGASTDELGNTVWQGVPADGEGAVTLVVHDGLVTGEVRLGGQKFGIAPTVSDHAVVEYRAAGQWRRDDSAPRTTGGASAPIPPAPARPSGTVERPAAGTPTISIMVAYTAAALALKPDMQGAVGLAIADLRTTLANSQISATVTLAGTQQTTYVELDNQTSDAVLSDAQIGAGDFGRIRQLQKNLGADILSVWSAYKDNCGLAYGMFYDGDPATVNLANAAYASLDTISADCGADTFTHEVGHLLGANHERYIIPDAVPGPNGYNYGYTDVGRFRDVMAYGNECDDTGKPCPAIQYFSNPNVNYQARPVGVADSDPKAADNARKIAEVLPYVAQLHSNFTPSTTPVLTISRSGRGTVTDTLGGLSCGISCNSALTAGARDSLTATPDPGWEFAGWSGGCTGTAATCSVTVNASVTVTATFTQSTVVQIGGVYSSTQPASQSFLRLYNTDSTAATATVSLIDSATGNVLGRWTSPSIPPGVEKQFGIADIESGASPAIATKPQFYTASVDSQFAGYLQHVLWHVSDNTLTNLTTCSSGAKADPARLIGVHSTLLGAGYPSSIVVVNTGGQGTAVTLGIYDALTGNRLGTFQTDTVTANGGEKIYSVSAIENAAGITPAAGMYHYIVKTETALTGHIAHLMQNVSAQVTTDMSTVCPMRSAATVAAVSRARQGAIFSSAQAGSQSFLRFLNAGSNFGSVTVVISNPDTGAQVASWTSANITAGAGLQVPITTIENAATRAFTKPDFYTVSITGNMTGEFQHVLWHSSDGTLTNLTTCAAGTRNNPWRLGAVHTTRLGSQGYASSVIVTNTGRSATRVTLTIADAADGSSLGSYQTASIPAGGQAILAVSDIETGARITAGSRNHYVVSTSAFSGYLQHQVNNAKVGVVTDMTATCGLQP